MRGKDATKARALGNARMATTDVSHAQPLGRGEVRPEARRSPTTSRARFDGIRRKCFILPMVLACGFTINDDGAIAKAP